MELYIQLLLVFLITRVYSINTTGNGAWHGTKCESDNDCRRVEPASSCVKNYPKPQGSGICLCQTNYEYNATEDQCQLSSQKQQEGKTISLNTPTKLNWKSIGQSQKSAIIAASVATVVGCAFVAVIIYVKRRKERSGERSNKKWVLNHIVVISPSSTKF
ncbi:hypothetical protein CHUAL_005356 [Chamberlinius hualienensis]